MNPNLSNRLILSSLWVATMLTYLLGDVLRLMAGDMKPGELNGVPATEAMWFLIAVIMLVPILMVVLSTVLKFPMVRRANIVMGMVVIAFNLLGLPYEGAYDNFLIGVSIVFNLLTIRYAWKWVS